MRAELRPGDRGDPARPAARARPLALRPRPRRADAAASCAPGMVPEEIVDAAGRGAGRRWFPIPARATSCTRSSRISIAAATSSCARPALGVRARLRRRSRGLGRVLDLGTGRGEFLEVMAEAGVDAYGVDTNTAAVDRCRSEGLDVVLDDALSHLAEAARELPRRDHGVPRRGASPVRAVDRADRPRGAGAAARAGCSCFETPNPTNLVVGRVELLPRPHASPPGPATAAALRALGERGTTRSRSAT